jgi:4-hydroxy-2-oxoglutarate aldolase
MKISGVFPPVATPFRNGGLDLDAARRNARAYMRTGLSGLVVLGTNGEAAHLEGSEPDELVTATRDEVPRDRLLIAGAGRDSTAGTIAAVRRAAACGADAVLVRPPTGFKSQMTGDVLVRHYTAVADAAPVPVLLYNFPNAFGIELTLPAIETLSRHENIAGIKESALDVLKIADDVARAREGFAVICGAAPVFYPALAVGAVAGILAVSGVVPDLFVRLFELVRDGRHDEARTLQARLTPLARSVTTGFGVPGLKAAMTLVGYSGGEPRAPLAPVSGEALATIKSQLAELGVPASA